MEDRVIIICEAGVRELEKEEVDILKEEKDSGRLKTIFSESYEETILRLDKLLGNGNAA